MYVSKIPKTILALVQPAVWATAARLFVLTTGRSGSRKYHPTVGAFYETGLVTALYEQLLMTPVLAHLEIRHEMPYQGPHGAPKRVDLWLRPVNGGYPHLLEAGDFSVGKIHKDVKKMQGLNPNGSSWFLAFFRKPDEAERPREILDRSFAGANGLQKSLVETDSRLINSFQVYRPNGIHEPFGVAMLRAK